MGEVLGYGIKVAVQVFILFVLIFTGYIMGKFKIIDKVGISQFVNILLYVVTPCVIINSFLSVDFNSKSYNQLLISAGCAVLTHLVSIAFAFIFCKEKEASKQSVYRFGLIFTNCGFMSIPLAQALIGVKGVFLVSTYVIVLNIFIWTYGVTLFHSDMKSSKMKALLNPGVVGVIIGLPLFFLSVQLPEIITKPVDYMASLNTPFAMIVTGFYLIGSNIKEGFSDKKLWATTVSRLFILPLIMLVIFKYAFGLSGDLLICLLIPACAPSAAATMMISAKFGGDTALASRLISVTTILSILTMPIILMLSKT